MLFNIFWELANHPGIVLRLCCRDTWRRRPLFLNFTYLCHFLEHPLARFHVSTSRCLLCLPIHHVDVQARGDVIVSLLRVPPIQYVLPPKWVCKGFCFLYRMFQWIDLATTLWSVSPTLRQQVSASNSEISNQLTTTKVLG